MNRKHIGSDFDDFLKEEVVLDGVGLSVLRELIAGAIAQTMQEVGVSSEVLAERLRMSRSKMRRFLDPKSAPVDLLTLYRVAKALGKDLEIGFS